jgi:hypothetical protein
MGGVSKKSVQRLIKIHINGSENRTKGFYGCGKRPFPFLMRETAHPKQRGAE